MNFDEIRPYKDEEVPEKIQSLINEEQFEQIITQVRPDVPFEEFKKQLSQIKTIRQFQEQFIVPLLDILIAKSTQGLSFHGTENLEQNTAYLFVSTHRDIVLDSAFMNYILLKEGFETAEIAIGDNLMKIPWVVDLVKLNKTFIVKRNVAKENKVDASLQLSSYINHTIKEKNESIWIAQKAGRSKDGNDRTNPSLLKMFNLAGEHEHALENLKALNIVPFAVSYEYNPCDILTMPELMTLARDEHYEKAPMEDMVHMGQGLEGKKGKVEICFGKPLNALLEDWKAPTNRNELFTEVANLIDREIHSTYKLMATNYIAYDLLYDSEEHAGLYTEEEKLGFKTYVESRIQAIEGDADFIQKTFLKMYAYPVKNAKEIDN